MAFVLQLQSVSKSFKSLQVFKDISFTLHKSEFVSLIGPSGCGKSTLFNIIAGVDEASSGGVLLNRKKRSKRRGRTGYMLQDPLLLPWRTVEENVILGLNIKKTPNTESSQKARKLLKAFGLFAFAKAYPRTLSGGMAQKVALLRTILFNNKLLLLDEPFASLDALTRSELQLWLLDVWQKEKASVLFITHDIREAILLSDRVLVMSQRPGKIIADVSIDLSRPRKRFHLRSTKALSIEEKLVRLLSENSKNEK